MQKRYVLIALAVMAHEALAYPSGETIWGLNYSMFVRPSTRSAMIGAEDLPPPLQPKAKACFERPAAQELERLIKASTGASKDMPSSLGRYGTLQTLLRSTCQIADRSMLTPEK